MAKKLKAKYRMATGRGWRKLVEQEFMAAGNKFYNDRNNTWYDIPTELLGKPWSALDYPPAKCSSKAVPEPVTPAAPTTAAKPLPAAIAIWPPPDTQGLSPVTDHELPDALMVASPYQLHNIRSGSSKYAVLDGVISEAKSSELHVGQYAYLCFEKRGVQSERMWVLIREKHGSTYKGELSNVPNHFDAKILRKGNMVTFSPCHVIKAVDGNKTAIV